eukprot:Gb_17219 [translate_table: standard]
MGPRPAPSYKCSVQVQAGPAGRATRLCVTCALQVIPFPNVERGRIPHPQRGALLMIMDVGGGLFGDPSRGSNQSLLSAQILISRAPFRGNVSTAIPAAGLPVQQSFFVILLNGSILHFVCFSDSSYGLLAKSFPATTEEPTCCGGGSGFLAGGPGRLSL